ncbi:MAG: hypothetical protein CMP07_05160 [Xanthomonadales bacterium]|nr:hypothetical protein [Xanthomonadales bacterium]
MPQPARGGLRFVSTRGTEPLASRAGGEVDVEAELVVAHHAFLKQHDPLLRPLRGLPGFTRLLDRIEVRA